MIIASTDRQTRSAHRRLSNTTPTTITHRGGRSETFTDRFANDRRPVTFTSSTTRQRLLLAHVKHPSFHRVINPSK